MGYFSESQLFKICYIRPGMHLAKPLRLKISNQTDGADFQEGDLPV